MLDGRPDVIGWTAVIGLWPSGSPLINHPVQCYVRNDAVSFVIDNKLFLPPKMLQPMKSIDKINKINKIIAILHAPTCFHNSSVVLVFDFFLIGLCENTLGTQPSIEQMWPDDACQVMVMMV